MGSLELAQVEVFPGEVSDPGVDGAGNFRTGVPACLHKTNRPAIPHSEDPEIRFPDLAGDEDDHVVPCRGGQRRPGWKAPWFGLQLLGRNLRPSMA